MRILRPPGVYAPQQDTDLLVRALAGHPVPPHCRVLDLCTGTGLLALAAARQGAAGVTAVDCSARAVLAVRLNARLNGVRVRVIRGDLADPRAGRGYDLVLANPPYVPAPDARPPAGGRARAVDAGPAGRALIDRICARAPVLVRPGGTLLMVHSGLCGTGQTLRALRGAGFTAEVAARQRVPFGPVLRGRADWLAARGLTERGCSDEELVVIRADRRQ